VEKKDYLIEALWSVRTSAFSHIIVHVLPPINSASEEHAILFALEILKLAVED
jgi:hypothetical protein